jgi:hypothetical protein
MSQQPLYIVQTFIRSKADTLSADKFTLHASAYEAKMHAHSLAGTCAGVVAYSISRATASSPGPATLFKAGQLPTSFDEWPAEPIGLDFSQSCGGCLGLLFLFVVAFFLLMILDPQPRHGHGHPEECPRPPCTDDPVPDRPEPHPLR